MNVETAGFRQVFSIIFSLLSRIYRGIANNLIAFVTVLVLSIASVCPAYASMAEYQAVLDLVPLSAVDRQVVQSGPWSDPDTWEAGVLPVGGDNIHVPTGLSLTVDIQSELGFGTLRVDGDIQFATDQDVTLKLDTLIVTSTGSFEIGSETDRLPSEYKIKVIIANNGPIDRERDPLNISRGVILQGKTRIFGAEKSAYHQLSAYPALGSSQISLESTPIGWVVGDTIAITATKFRKKQKNDASFQTEDELRRIESINGNVIVLGDAGNPELTAPLKFSHVPANTKMPVFVANLTRNVVFATEGGDAVPPSQRGHFMVMHNPDTIIKGASFNFMGRTDKSIPLDDFKLDDRGNRLTDDAGQYVPDASNNPRGRYSVHFHHTGTDITVPPAICSGNAVFGSEGWGFVNHSSNVIMENNASYDVYGSHYVSEDGNELGAFKNNIAIKAEGRSAIVKEGVGNHDHGHTGHGIWLHSRNLVVENNVVSGVNNAGLVYYHRNAVSGIDLDIPWQNLLTSAKNIVKALPTLYFSDVPIVHQKNTTVLASASAFNVVKASRDQGHDLRNMIEGLKGYAVVDGLQIQYTEKYTFVDLDLVADVSSSKWDRGVNVGIRDRDIAFINASVSGFVHPFITGTTFQGLPDETDVVFTNAKVNGRDIIPEIDIHQNEIEIMYNYNPLIHKILVAPDSDGGIPSLVQTALNNTYDLPTRLADGFAVAGIKTDSLGDIAFESKWVRDSLVALLKKGYYTMPDGTMCIVLIDSLADRATGQRASVVTKLKNVQNYRSLGPFLGEIPE